MANKSVPILDKGYVQLIETWGSDERIIEAARMSTGKGFNGWGEDPCTDCNGFGRGQEYMNGSTVDSDVCGSCGGAGKTVGDEKLLAYLYNNNHATPFEMAGMIIEVKAPIFIFREWHRHRTQSYNEMSARYIPLPDDNYVPTIERIMMTSSTNKQAQSAGGVLEEYGAKRFQDDLVESYKYAEDSYQDALAMGVPKELARLGLPVGRYSRMRASANLRNWLAFLTLRDHPAAQWEIQQYAKEVGNLIQEAFPHTYELFDLGRKKHG